MCDCRFVMDCENDPSSISLGTMTCEECLVEPACDFCQADWRLDPEDLRTRVIRDENGGLRRVRSIETASEERRRRRRALALGRAGLARDSNAVCAVAQVTANVTEVQ